MAVGLFGVERLVGFPASLLLRMLWLGSMIVFGALLYGVILHVLGVIDLASVLARIRRRVSKR
jgi:putative peptidoglycan lipid II flippase